MLGATSFERRTRCFVVCASGDELRTLCFVLGTARLTDRSVDKSANITVLRKIGV